MISVVILGFGLTLAANSYLVALRAVSSSANNIAALSLAKEKFEELEALSLESPSSVSSSQSILKPSTTSYDYKQEIIEIAGKGDLAESLVQACLSLSWQEHNATKNVIFSTYLSKQKQ